MSAYFGPPASTFVPGGGHVAVYLVPVYQEQLVVFDVEARQARGRWLPWNVLTWGGNPYEMASELADLWCQVPLNDLALTDIMSFPSPEDSWELAIVFRAELSEPARGDDVRTPYFFPKGQFDAIGPFDPIDLERWVTGSVVTRPEASLTSESNGDPTPGVEPSASDVTTEAVEPAATVEPDANVSPGQPPKPGPLLF